MFILRTYLLAYCYDAVGSRTAQTATIIVVFTDTSTGPNGITAWLWDFGDGVTGTLLGSNFAVSATSSVQEYPDVAYNATTGEYLVAWHQDSLVYARRVLSDGAPSGAAVLVSHENGQPPASGLAERPALAYNPDQGHYLVAWADTRHDPGGVLGDILVQRLSLTGTLVGANTAVLSRTLDEFHAAVAYNPVAGEYLVAALGGAYDSVLAQRVSDAGVAVGNVITVTTPTPQSGAFGRPAVAAESDGESVVVWTDQDRAGLQRLTASGAFIGGAIVVDDDVNAEDASVAYGADDNSHLVAWIGVGSAYARVFRPVDADFSASPVQGSAPLVQVLVQQDAGGKTAYLYGVTRVGEQQLAGWVYHLPDALGSVRQLVDGSAQVALARGYMPYGEVLWSAGDGSSAYGFTGEALDASVGLVFLRARYMHPGLGMFLSPDPWNGDAQRPSTMNGWIYAEGNPVNRVDPSGRMTASTAMSQLGLEDPSEGNGPFDILMGLIPIEILEDDVTFACEDGDETPWIVAWLCGRWRRAMLCYPSA